MPSLIHECGAAWVMQSIARARRPGFVLDDWDDTMFMPRLLEMLLARLSRYFLCSLASFRGSAVALDMRCGVGHMDMAPGVCLWKAFPM